MYKPEVIEFVRRGNYSKIAMACRNMELPFPVKITVSQNAPCCIQNSGYFPAKLGWVEYKNNTDSIEKIVEQLKSVAVWVKTATLGGRKRIWTK